jgi:hypothetical protein
MDQAKSVRKASGVRILDLYKQFYEMILLLSVTPQRHPAQAGIQLRRVCGAQESYASLTFAGMTIMKNDSD